MSAPSTPPRKKKPTGGRVTPKGTGSPGGPRRAATTEGHDGHPGASSRYTPPVPRSEKVTAPWVVPVMFLLLGLEHAQDAVDGLPGVNRVQRG